MATVEKRGKVWCVRYVVKDAYGKIVGQKRKSGFKTKEDAMAMAKALEQATASGVDVHGDQLTCGELMEKWFLTKPDEIELTTLAKYSNYMDRLRETGIYDTKVAHLSSNSLSVLVQEMTSRGISVKSAAYYTEPLRFSLQWATKEGIIMRNPLVNAKLPKSVPRKQVILSEEDIDDLVRVCKARNPAFLVPLYLAVYGGLSREEAAGLKWSNVLPNSVRIVEAVTSTVQGSRVEKGTKTVYRERTVTLPRFVMDYLAIQEHTSEYVCVSRTGEPYCLSAYAHTVNRLVKMANQEREAAGKVPMPIPSYHDLRHTHAAMLIAMGIQPKVIQERLGHSSITVTMDLYGYLMPGLQEQVADALDQRWA